jgi:hypothetical protein
MRRLIPLLPFLILTSAALAAPATKPAVPQPVKFPSYGATFSLPGGWTEIPREKAGRIGQWISPDSKPQQIKSLIMIETGRPGATSAENMAKGLARNFGGAVMDQPTKLDGESALVVRADNHDDELAPVFGLVCVHGDNVYLIMGGALKDRDVRDEIEVIRKSWKWTAVEKPSSHLAFRDQPFDAMGGAVRLNFPQMMHSNAADDPTTQFDLSLYNLLRNNSDFRASMTLSTLRQDETFEQAKDRFLTELTEKQKLKDAPKWQPRQGATPRVLTPSVEVPRPQPAETETLHHQWAAVSLGDAGGKMLLIHFTHEAETDEERHQYEQAAAKIVDSVAAQAKAPH